MCCVVFWVLLVCAVARCVVLFCFVLCWGVVSLCCLVLFLNAVVDVCVVHVKMCVACLCGGALHYLCSCLLVVFCV